MSRTPDQPRLTPQFCFNQTQLRDFLRLSRSAVDDTINQNLNALLTPGSKPFDPSSTSERQPRPGSRRPIDAAACDQFKQKILFPSWQSRTDVLHYCEKVATAPDPENAEPTETMVDSRLVDERSDPYNSRNLPREGKKEALAALIMNEKTVESIIRERTWRLVNERCENDGGAGAEQSLEDWRRKNAESER